MSSDARKRDIVSLRQDDEPGVYTAEISDESWERPSVYVPYAVAMATGRDLETLPPLYASIDPDALDALFADRPTGDERQGGEVTFPYDGVTVTLTADRDVRVRVHESRDDDRIDG